jgi:hypothetical protein
MKPAKRTLHVVKHIPTGAKVPVEIKKVDKNNTIQDFVEWTRNRKGFTLRMLQDRWDKCAQDVLEILHQYQVPAHVRHEDVVKLKEGQFPTEVAIFFEEYVYALEKKAKLPHSKLKARALINITEH